MKKILIIDDKMDNETLLGKKIKEVVESRGYGVIFTKTWEEEGYGIKAKDILSQYKEEIALILLDIFFPGQSLEGGDIFEILKEGYPNIPVAILTQKDPPYTEVKEFLERGATKFIVKTDFSYINRASIRDEYVFDNIKGEISTLIDLIDRIED